MLFSSVSRVKFVPIEKGDEGSVKTESGGASEVGSEMAGDDMGSDVIDTALDDVTNTHTPQHGASHAMDTEPLGVVNIEPRNDLRAEPYVVLNNIDDVVSKLIHK